MTLALSLFVLFYILMLAVQQYRPWVALGGVNSRVTINNSVRANELRGEKRIRLML